MLVFLFAGIFLINMEMNSAECVNAITMPESIRPTSVVSEAVFFPLLPFKNITYSSISYPRDIIQETDKNQCSALIKTGLNIDDPQHNLQSLSWEMTGATSDRSPNSGINQIDVYLFNKGSTRIIYSGISVNNNPVIHEFTVTVVDNQVPVMVAPPTAEVICNHPVPEAFINIDGFIQAGGELSDNCEIDRASFAFVSESRSGSVCPFTITRTYQVQDNSGNIAEIDHHIRVKEEVVVLKSGQADYTAISGNWSSTATWGGALPNSGDNIIIPSGVTVTVDITTAVCNTINIESGGTLIISGSNKLTVYGSWNNSGSFDAGTDGTVEFTGTNNAEITGATTFENLIVSKGSLSTSLLINGNVNVSGGGGLSLSGGLISIPGTGSLSLNFSAGLTIPSTAGFDVIGGTLTTGNFSITNNGLIRVNSGTAEFGTSAGNTVHTQVDGAFIVNGGIVDISGRLENTAGGTLTPPGVNSGISISAGTVTLATAGNGLSSVGSLNVTANGDFRFTGGTIVFQNPSTATTELDLGIIGGAGTKLLSGGTFQFGNASTPNNSTFVLDTEIPLSNLSTGNNADLVLNGDLAVSGSISLDANSTIELNGYTLERAISTGGTYSFPIADDAGNPVSVTITISGGFDGDESIEITTSNIKHPDNESDNHYLNQYWEVGLNGITNPNYSISAQYQNADISGTENEIAAGIWDGSSWTKFGAAGGGTILASNVSGTTIWFTGITLDDPTVEINGGNATENICSGSSVALSANVTGDNPITYSWTSTPPGFTSTSSSVNVNPLVNTTYTLTITDGNGFTATDDIQVVVDPQPTASTNGGATICENSSYTLGAGEANASNGNILWTENGFGAITAGANTLTPTYTAASGDAGNVVTLTMTVTSDNACSPQAAVAVYAINVDPLPTASAGGSETICAGSSTTVSGASASNGTILWTHNGLGALSSDGTLAPTYTAAAGDAGNDVTLTLTVTGTNDCAPATSTDIFTVTVREPLSSSTISTAQDICYNGVPQSLVGTAATGGSGSYSYQWQSSPDGTGSWTNVGTNSLVYSPPALTATTFYRLEVSDLCGTEYSNVVEVNVAPELTASDAATAILCNGGSAMVTLSANGGTAPYSYTFNGVNDADGVIANVTAGTYNWSVTDARNCGPVTGTIILTEPDAIAINLATVTTPVSCNGGTGEVTISATGGTGNLQYTFNGQTNTTGIFSGVYAGTNYSYSVTDDNGCGPVFGSLNVDDLDPLNASVSVAPMLCNGGASSGEITVSKPVGGSGAYEVSINGTNWFSVSTASSYTFSGLATGNYYVEIRDQAMPTCSQTLPNVTITEPPVLNAAISETSPISCFGGTAEIKISVSGGTGAKTFSFEGQADNTSGNFSGIPAGTYNWSVTDVNGCSFWGTYKVTSPSEIVITSISSNSAVCEGETLNLYSDASGGTGSLTYSWQYPDGTTHNGQNPIVANATSADNGTYTLTVTDVNNCAATTTTAVVIHPTPALNVPSDMEVCNDENISSIVFSGADSYSWTNDETSIGLVASGTGSIPSFTATNTGSEPVTATITVTPEGNGCAGIPQTFTITVNPVPNVIVDNRTPVLCDDLETNIILTSDVEGTTFTWEVVYVDGWLSGASDGSGNIINQQLDNSGAWWQGNAVVRYRITPTANGCQGAWVEEDIEVLRDDYDLEVNFSSSPPASEITVCSGQAFSFNYTGNNGWGWDTHFYWETTNSSIWSLGEGGGPQVNSGNLSFTTINNTDEVQSAVISIIPWAFYDGWWGSYYLCSGEPYSFTLNVQPFTIECPTDIIATTDIGECDATLSPSQPVINCDPGTSLSWSMSDGNSGNGTISNYNFESGTTTVTYRAEQSASNFRTCTFDVSVTDNEAPSINCPVADTTIYATAGQCGVNFDFSHIQASDNCSVDQFIQTEGPASGSEFLLGTTTLAFYAEDASGNHTECSFDVIVLDTISPTIACIGDTTVCADPGADYTNIGTDWDAMATDNCTGVRVEYSVDGAVVGNTLNNVAFSVAGSPHTVIATATDAGARTATCSFLVTVNEKPDITLNPTDQSVCLTGTATLTVAASGTPEPTYRWRKDGVPLSDDTNYSGTATASLIISGLTAAQSGSYDAVATNSCGDAISLPAVLNVSSAPVITTNPASQTDCEGNLVEFDVVSQQGNTPYSYFWEMRETSTAAWVDAASVNNIEFNVDRTQLRVDNIGNSDNPDQSQYRVIVTDACGISDTSTVATLTVNEVIRAELALDTICSGEGTMITAITDGATPLSYQWMFNDGSGWIDITDNGIYSGTTAMTLTINNATTAESGEYRFAAVFPVNKLNSSVTDCQRTLSIALAEELYVDDGPDIVATTTTPAICSDDNVEIKIYDAKGVSGVTYSWSRTNESQLAGNFTETWIADTLVLNGTLNSTLPGTYLSTGFTITGTSVHGCQSQQQISIQVGDEELPVVETCQNDTTINSDSGNCGVVVNYLLPTFSDNCDGTALTGTLVEGLAPGETFPSGITTVTYEFTDAAGNGPISCSFNVTVNDNEPPLAACNATVSVELDAAGTANISVADINNNSTDNCGIDSMWLDITAFDCTNLGDNTVTLTVRDSSGLTDNCISVVTVNDNVNPVNIVVDSIAQTPIDCYGGLATVTIYASGGVGTLTYTLEGQAPNQSGVFNAIPAGSYSWSITDPQNCGDTISASDFVVIQPNELNANIALTEVTCSSGDDGTITVIGSFGGSGGYEYQLLSSVENRSWQGDSVFANLSPGFYDIWMRDANAPSCEIEIQSNVEVYIITASISETDITCYNGTDGVISISGSTGGTPPYQYSVNGGINWQASGEFTGLSADTFNVQIQDNDACIVVLDSMVILTHPDSLHAAVTATNISCGGAADGSISLSAATGGTGSYQYSINGGSGWKSATDFTALAPGVYDVWLMDGSSCQKFLERVEITEPLPLAADLDSSNITCFEGNDGSIIISNPTGGSGSYEYSIDNGITWQDSGNYVNLVAGTYQVVLRDSNAVNCELILDANLILDEPAPLQVTSAPNDFADCEGSTAQFSVGHSAGVGTVNYRWQKQLSGIWTDLANGGDVTGTDLATLQIANIEPADTGLFRVIIEDDCLPDTSLVVSLTVNAVIDVLPNATTVTICGGTDTSFTVNVIGNNPVFQWQKYNGTGWDNVSDNSVISGSQSNSIQFSGTTINEIGQYQVLVTFDKTSGTTCSIESGVLYERNLDVLPTPTLDSIPDFTYCEGDYPAPIPLSGSPSNVTYDMTISNYIGLFDQTNITGNEIVFPGFVSWGTATVTVTPKANGCIGTPRSFKITVTPLPVFSVAPPVQTICSGDETNIAFNGNTDSIRYDWTVAVSPNDGSVTGWKNVTDSLLSGIQQTLVNTNSTPATVTYSITPNKDGCYGLVNTVTITVQPAIEFVITNPDTVCAPATVDITDPDIVAGSTAGLTYEYYIDSAMLSYVPDPTSVNAGEYFIKATDPATGCYNILPVSVVVVSAPTVAINQPDPICPTESIDLQTTIDMAATTPGMTFTYWDTDTNQIFNSIVNTDGTYFIQGETAGGCADFQEVIVTVYTDVETPVFADGFTSDECKGAAPRVYSATAVNATGLVYSLDAASISAGNSISSSTGELTFDPDFTGDIIITVTATGCTAPTTAIHTVTVHEPPTVTLMPLNTTICLGESVELTANSSGSSVNETFSGSSGTINLTIPEGGNSASNSINLSGSGGQTLATTDILIVTIDITHPQDRDLDIFLVDPSGTRAILLSSDNGEYSDNYSNTIFRTDATSSIVSGSPPYNGEYHPEGDIDNSSVAGEGHFSIPTENLDGAGIDGNWTIHVFDDNSYGNLGSLNNWSLSIIKQAGSGFTTWFNGPDDIGLVNYSGSSNETASVWITPTTEGTHTYTATTRDANGCEATSNEVTITVQETPGPHISADYCTTPGYVRLTAFGGATGASYQWRNSNNDVIGNTQIISVDIVDIYNVTITNPNGCSATEYLDVSNELVINGDFEAGNTSFSSGYGYRPSWTFPAYPTSAGESSLWDENYYGVGFDARYYHTNFWGQQDHTSGDGNFMIVNGNLNAGTPIWEQVVNVEPNTNYYFSAWSMSLNSAGNDAVLQFEVNGVLVGTQARLSPGVSNNTNNGWIRFYSNPLWNSGSVSGPITIRIRNVEPAAGGNDFGLDDISFGTLDPFPLVVDVAASDVCEGDTLFLYSNSDYGLEPIEYLWTGPNGWTSSEENPVIPNISLSDAGQYKLEATDGYGCEILPDSVTVIVETAPTVDAGPDTLVCSADSVIMLNGVIGGSANSANWTGGSGTFDPGVNSPVASYTLSRAEINAGVAILVLSTDDPPGICEPATDTLIISIHESPQIDSVVTTEPLCNNVLNGTANIYMSGGAEPYSYLWSTGHTTPSVSGLGADTFWIQVTDANLCVVSDTFIITEPEPFVISPTSPIVVPPSCFGAADGWALVEVSGGIPPYRFDWDINADPLDIYQDTAFNLQAGIYNIYVTDSAYCAASNIQVTVPQPPPPVLTCPPDYEDIIGPDSCSITYDTFVDPYYNGFCDVTLTYTVSGATNTTGTGSVNGQVAFNVGQSTVEYRIEDAAGNIDSCSFNVWVKHLDLPTANISCPTDSVTQDIDPGTCAATITTLDPPVISDPCNEIDSIWHNSPYGTSANDASGLYPAGITGFRWFITDVSGNIDSSCTVVVTVNDVEPPQFITCPTDTGDVIADDSCSISNFTLTDPTYSDNCTPVLTYTLSGATTGSGTGSASGETFNIGQTIVRYVLTDSNNNTDVCEFIVWLKHLNVPVGNYSCPQDSVWATPDVGECDADVILGTLTYTDPCYEIDSVWNESPYGISSADASGTYPVGTTTFNWYISDISGNIDSCEVTVIVEDLLPSISCPPDVDTTADYGEMYNSAVVLQDPVYADNCPDPQLTWILIPPVGYEPEYNSGELSGIGIYVSPDTFWVGETTIWYYVEDSNGNRDSCSFTVTVQAAPEIECPPDTTIYLDGSECTCAAAFDPGVADLIQGTPPITWTYTITFPDGSTQTDTYIKDVPDPEPNPLGVLDFPAGVTTIEWRADNISGYDTCSHWIEVIDTIPPSIDASPYEDCVDYIEYAIYNPSNPNPIYHHLDPNLEKSPSPDYSTFYAGSTDLDLTLLTDNCCDSLSMVNNLTWTIDFQATLDPITGATINPAPISGTGQPSAYGADIQLWGDGVDYATLSHTITYRVSDCNGNLSEEIVRTITITPRPEIIKQN